MSSHGLAIALLARNNAAAQVVGLFDSPDGASCNVLTPAGSITTAHVLYLPGGAVPQVQGVDVQVTGFPSIPPSAFATGATAPGGVRAEARSTIDADALRSRRARHSLDEVPARVEPIALKAAEEKSPIFRDRPAHRAAELIQLERRLGNG